MAEKDCVRKSREIHRGKSDEDKREIRKTDCKEKKERKPGTEQRASDTGPPS